MNIFLLTLLINFIFGIDIYELLINEKVSEEYCNYVIGNMTALINEGYVYSDFLKAPKQPKPDYFRKMDIIDELKKIKTTNRTFYDFYAEIQNIFAKTEDGHFLIYPTTTPNKIPLYYFYFCIPFHYYIEEVYNDDNITIKDAYLTIEPLTNFCQNSSSNETLSKIKKLAGKKIISINNLNPFDYLEKMVKSGTSPHSSQCKFIEALEYIKEQPLHLYPHKKEDLFISIKFEGNEILNTMYSFEKKQFLNDEFKEFFLEEQKKYIKNTIHFPKFEEIEKKFRIKKGLINKLKDSEDRDIWDLKSGDEFIKCRVDNENEFNVLYQSSFYPENFNDYEDIMYKCFSKFYSNDYKIIIIENRNGGGYTELCIPFTQYVSPKIYKPTFTAMKSTELNLKNFFRTDENLNPETCFPYTEEDDILEGPRDIYEDGTDKVFHKRTKDIEYLNIFEKKIMEKKRKEYLKTGKTKKPTDILVFTDGYSFSCTSFFIKGLQIHGHAIIVGYNARPDLNKSDFDASQSNSCVETFDISENTQNLNKLGFYPSITFLEEFDPYDKENPKIPMEFKIYPVDEISSIYKDYNDKRYYRFIDEAKKIFKKYEEQCNPDNKILYKEAEDCDLKINIPKAHGGYICGKDGKWNNSQCIAAYCDDGYYLNNDRTECIKDPCDNIKLNEIIINERKEKQIIIEPNNIYIFTIEKVNYSYYFYCELDNFFYVLNEHHILEAAKNGTAFKNRDKIYVNYFVNITKNINIFIKVVKENEMEEEDENNEEKKDKISDKKGWLSTGIIILIVIFSVIIVILIFLIIYFLKKKKNDNFEEQLTSIES